MRHGLFPSPLAIRAFNALMANGDGEKHPPHHIRLPATFLLGGAGGRAVQACIPVRGDWLWSGFAPALASFARGASARRRSATT